MIKYLIVSAFPCEALLLWLTFQYALAPLIYWRYEQTFEYKFNKEIYIARIQQLSRAHNFRQTDKFLSRSYM